MGTQAILEIEPTKAKTGSTASVLSYAIFVGGLLTFALAVYMVAVCYTRLPFWDGWDEFQVLASGHSPTDPGWLWEQHNEHRWVIPKLFMAVDSELFHGNQVFLLVCVLAIQLVHWSLLSWSMRVLGGWRGALWRTGAGLAGFCLFCPAQWQNLIWGFQVCYLLPQVLASAAFITLLLYWKESVREPGTAPRPGFLVLSILAALAATYSLSSGNFLWPVLVLAALYLRLRISAVLAIAVTGGTSLALYLYHYVRPPAHANPLESLRAPLSLLKYWAMYFISSWQHRNMPVWETVAVLLLVLVIASQARALTYVGAFRPLAIQLLLTMLFCAITALVTASGRLNMGIEQAGVSRYQTIALFFWCSLGLLWLGGAWFGASRMPYAFPLLQVCLLLIFVRGALTARYPLTEAKQRTFGMNVASAALIAGVHEPITLAKAYPQVDVLVDTARYIKAHGLSIFSGPAASEMGKPLTSVFPVAGVGQCIGVLKGGFHADAPSGPGDVLAGWAWDIKHREPASSIVVTTNGRITGLGAVGEWLPDARTKAEGINSSYIGFYAFLPDPPPQAVVNVYAVIPGHPDTACYIDGWRKQ